MLVIKSLAIFIIKDLKQKGINKMPKQEKTEKHLLMEISEKLDKLLGVIAIRGKNKYEQVKVLASLGFTNKEISDLTAIPKGTVDGIRAKSKKG